MEMLLSLVVTGTVLLCSMYLFTVTMRLFRDTKSQSDNIETKSPSIELLSRYFDRWGAGVVSQAEKSACTGTLSDGLGNTISVCPATEKTLTISTDTIGGVAYSNVSFYGNVQGFGFVQTIVTGSTPTASIVGCRLIGTETANMNCHNVWRNSGLLNDISSSAIVPLAFQQTMNSVDCLTATAANQTGVNYTLTGAGGNKNLAAGDVIQRAPFHIRLFCQQNSNDGNRIWLYVKMTDTAASCNAGDTAAQPVLPADAFTALAVPSVNPASASCTAATGGNDCGAVQINLTLRGQTRRLTGAQYDTINISRVFWR